MYPETKYDTNYTAPIAQQNYRVLVAVGIGYIICSYGQYFFPARAAVATFELITVSLYFILLFAIKRYVAPLNAHNVVYWVKRFFITTLTGGLFIILGGEAIYMSAGGFVKGHTMLGLSTIQMLLIALLGFLGTIGVVLMLHACYKLGRSIRQVKEPTGSLPAVGVLLQLTPVIVMIQLIALFIVTELYIHNPTPLSFSIKKICSIVMTTLYTLPIIAVTIFFYRAHKISPTVTD